MATRFANPAPQFFYNGTPAAPLAGGLMYFYEPGSSLTPKNTYSDNTLSIPNSNPVILSSSGVLPNVFLDGAYRVILKDKNGVQQWDRDSINSINLLAFGDWDPTINYGIGGANIVYASDGIYYISIDTPNLGNDPSVSPLYWMRAIDYFLLSQTTIEPGNIGVGGDPDGIISLNTSIKGTLAVGDGTTTAALPVGTNALVLTADSSEPEGVAWLPIPDTTRDYQVFTASGDWTKPDSVGFVLVELWSGGGGGANRADSNGCGGGSGGEYVSTLIRASDLGATVAVTVGAGGAGGATAGINNGNTGGTTSFGSHVSAIGGNPGKANDPLAIAPIPRSAATSTLAEEVYGSAATQAGYGGPSADGGGRCIYGGGGGGGSANGIGGVSETGGNGGAGNTSSGVKGGNGVAPGGGGGGSGANGGGGDGARGEVRVWTW